MNHRTIRLVWIACVAVSLFAQSKSRGQTTVSVSVQIQQSTPGFTVHGESAGGMSYVATIGSDGSMTNFGMGFFGIFDSTVPGAPGGFVQQKGLVSAERVEQHNSSIVATSARAKLVYIFSNQGVKIELTNKSQSPLRYRIVPGVFVKHAITEGDNAQAYRLPSEAKTEFPTALTLAHTTIGLHITGGGQNGGILEHNRAMIDFIVQPMETKSLELELRPLTAEQRVLIAAAEAPAKVSAIEIVSPVDYQVVQRQSKEVGRFRIDGTVHVDADSLEAQYVGKMPSESVDWTRKWTIAIDKSTRTFHGDMGAPAGGWYRVEIRAMKNGEQVAITTIDHVGMGEVFIGAGQSNSTNYGDGGKLRTETGMVSAFSGTNWQLANDPQPGTHDDSTMGSFWPAFGDAMYAKYKVPIGIAVTGHGGTSINQWHAGDELFNWTLQRMGQFGPGGFRAVLWHQGESDTDMTADEYRNGLANIIHDFKQRAGWDFPFFVAQATYHNPEAASFSAIRDAQKALWDSGVALEGPDTDTLVGDDRDQNGRGIHLSVKGRIAHGKMWAEKVGKYLDRWLDQK